MAHNHHDSSDPRFKPISNICMALNAFHIYADEAREGKTRPVMSYHYCSHISEGNHITLTLVVSILTLVADLRQCLVYDSNSPNARLIGVEYMIPKEKVPEQ